MYYIIGAAGIVSGDVDWNELALSHELTGGLIKNAVLSALSLAVQGQEQGERVLLTQQHLVNGAKLQLRCVPYICIYTCTASQLLHCTV